MRAVVAYAGRVYEYVSYECSVTVPSPATFSQLQLAREEAILLLRKSHPTVKMDPQETVGAYFGNQTLTVVAKGTVVECSQCGVEGHRPSDCKTEF